MQQLEYIEFGRVDPDEFVGLLNREKIRQHLIAHDLFNSGSIQAWVNSKIGVDAQRGCRVRAICDRGKLIGWCGIQRDGDRFEAAVVLDESGWGNGKRVFGEVMQWAREFGHRDLFVNLLHTRRQYRFLTKLAKNVFRSQIHGNQFITYQLPVN